MAAASAERGDTSDAVVSPQAVDRLADVGIAQLTGQGGVVGDDTSVRGDDASSATHLLGGGLAYAEPGQPLSSTDDHHLDDERLARG